MAYYRQTAKGEWRAQICRRGVRRAETFKTKQEAERWAEKTEREILDAAHGKHQPIRLEPDELSRIYNKAKENAKQRGLAFEIRRDDVVMLFGRSRGVCEVTGILFNRFKPQHCTKRPWFPSLDRIDSKQPYTLDNCRLVCIAANFAMCEWGEWVLKALANAVCYGRPGLLINGPTENPRRRGVVTNTVETTV